MAASARLGCRAAAAATSTAASKLRRDTRSLEDEYGAVLDMRLLRKGMVWEIRK
jgi:hypothetical protein